MNCKIDIDDIITVSDQENPNRVLHLDISPFYCRLFETTRLQCRDYLEEILKWTDGKLDNYEYVSNNIMHVTSARRRSYGIKK